MILERYNYERLIEGESIGMAMEAENKGKEFRMALDTADIILQHITQLDRANDEDELESILPELMESIGKCTNADRSYVVEWFSDEEDVFRMTCEWCDENVKPTFTMMQNVKSKDTPNWMPMLLDGEPIISYNWDRDRVLFPEEYKVFDGQDIHSLVILPIFSNNKLNGYIGLDNPEQNSADLTLRLLSVIGGHLGSVKERFHMVKKLQEKLEEANLNNEIISSISKIYWLIYRMDLLQDTYEEVSAGQEMHRLTGNRGKITETFQNVRENVVASEYQDKMREFLDISTLTERLKNTETISAEYHAANGAWHMARFIVKKRDSYGNVTNVLYLAREINKEKEQEMEYERRLAKIAEEAQRANMAKTDFLRRMSHDIRTPINGIRGMLSIANHFPDDLEKQRECREKAIEASGYLLDLVNNVLDMNKLESGTIVLERKPFDLLKLFDESNSIVEMQSKMDSIPFIVNNYNITHTHLIGSPVHIKQILQNIVGNAMKYNRPSGRVEVTCTETDYQDGRATYKMTCSDTGYGMSKEFQKHAFEPFAQEQISARTTYMGTGLGLSIVKQLVELMGGTITLESELNVGTKFTIMLTFDVDQSAYETKKTTKELKHIRFDGIHTLLVEDNELNMEIAKFMLEQLGMTVTMAWNGQEAVERFKESEESGFDLVMMDVMMPVMNGLDATRQIRHLERKDAGTVPIFAMTANAFPDDIQQSRDAGMNAHLSKPLQKEEILETIMCYVRPSKM